jgi:hypothetical protein
MSSSDGTETHSETTKHDQQVEEDYFEETERPEVVEAEHLEEESNHKSDFHLKRILCNDDKLYLALENFLLGDPKSQTSEFGDGNSDSLLANGNEARAKGFKKAARAYYETSAKIEIYKQDKDRVISSLLLAEEVTEDVEHSEFHKIILANMDKVLRISKEYYESVQPTV